MEGRCTTSAGAPSGDEFVACGRTGVTITSPTSAHQTVTVPAGGAGNGKFYVQPKPTGYLEICKQESGTGLENQVFTFSVVGHNHTVPVGACTPHSR